MKTILMWVPFCFVSVPDVLNLQENELIDNRIATIIVIAQLDRLCQPFARKPDEDLWNDDPDRLAILYKPLCMDVKPETLEVLSDIMDICSPGYFSQSGCPDSAYITNMYTLVACLRILKVFKIMSHETSHQSLVAEICFFI